MSLPVPADAARFFDSYVGDFERFDAGAIADHFTYPCQLIGDAETIDLRCVADRDEWVGQLEQLVDLYKSFGVVRAQILDSRFTPLTERVVQAAMQWSLRDSSDAEIYSFRALYTLVDDAGRWKIAAIAHDELPKIMERLAAG